MMAACTSGSLAQRAPGAGLEYELIGEQSCGGVELQVGFKAASAMRSLLNDKCHCHCGGAAAA